MMIQVLILATIFRVCSTSSFVAAESPIVRIRNGTLEGTVMTSRKGREFFAFRNIPYAQPPIGNLRFQPPKSIEKAWIGVRSAKEDGNICIQSDVYGGAFNISEDCLYLNVYSPKLPSNNWEQRKYSVMIWLYGGSWSMGAGHSKFYGPKFLLDYEIVLVTLNYRTGPLGFLSTEDFNALGNQGMKDQAQSIKWVHENILSFGGDPNSVTIFGESAGGISARLHAISPLSRGIFHKGITQSGEGTIPDAISRPGIAKKNAKRLAKLLNCPVNDSKALVKCLRKKKGTDFNIVNTAFVDFDGSPLMPFRPVIEPDHPGAFVKEEPTESLRCGNVADIPWLTGINSEDGAVRVAALYGPKHKGYVKQYNDHFEELALQSLLMNDMIPEFLTNNATKSIRDFYFGNKSIDESTRMNVVDMVTDAWFLTPADNAVRYHLRTLRSPIYYYRFAYRGNSSYIVFFGDTERDYGVVHGDELQYLFPVGEQLFPYSTMSENDYKMVDVMTSLWTNFAKTGNPTPQPTALLPVTWMPARSSKHEYFNIDGPNNLSMASDLRLNRILFWNTIPTNIRNRQCPGTIHRG